MSSGTRIQAKVLVDGVTFEVSFGVGPSTHVTEALLPSSS